MPEAIRAQASTSPPGVFSLRRQWLRPYGGDNRCVRARIFTEEAATVSTQSILNWVIIATRSSPTRSVPDSRDPGRRRDSMRAPNLAQIGRGMAGPVAAKEYHQTRPGGSPAMSGSRSPRAWPRSSPVGPQAEEAALRQLRLDRVPRLPHPDGRRLYQRSSRPLLWASYPESKF